MNAIMPFEFEANTVRVVEIDSEPWFVAKDVCAVLGLDNVTMALRRLDDDEVTLNRIEGSHRPTNLISESGLYCLVLRSDKPQAKQFRKWVTSEVLPSIRKTGLYAAQPLRDPALIAIQHLLFDSQALKDRVEKVETEQVAIKEKLSEFDSATGYRTITAFCRENDMQLPLSDANALGRKAARICRHLGLRIGTIHDERFGSVNSYPISVLQDLVQDKGAM